MILIFSEIGSSVLSKSDAVARFDGPITNYLSAVRTQPFVRPLSSPLFPNMALSGDRMTFSTLFSVFSENFSYKSSENFSIFKSTIHQGKGSTISIENSFRRSKNLCSGHFRFSQKFQVRIINKLKIFSDSRFSNKFGSTNPTGGSSRELLRVTFEFF